MSDFHEWQQKNDRRLMAAVAALRERLVRFSQAAATSAQADSSDGTTTPPVVEAAADDDSLSALDELVRRLRLSPFEEQVLLLCAAMELDASIAGWCARAHGDPEKAFPTFALALSLFEQSSWDVLSPERPLRYWRLIEINQPGATPLTTSALRVDERIVNYLKGLNYLDDRLSVFMAELEQEPRPEDLAPSQLVLAESILRRLDQTAALGQFLVVQLTGPNPVGKQLIASHVAAAYGRRLYRLSVDLLPTAPGELETLARFWRRESRLLPLALYLDAQELDRAAAERITAISRFLAGSDGVLFLGVREELPRLSRAHAAWDVPKPTVAEQLSAWTEILGQSAGETPAWLSAQFNMNLPTLRQIAELARAETHAAPTALAERMWDECCASQRPQLDRLAHRVTPTMTWSDLVLPATETRLLRQVATQVRQRQKVYEEWGFARKMNRGFGITALFAGDSGTGKTMAAEIIANDLRLSLYRIDLSAVVNKYLGETEKNLCRLFDAAEDGGAILFFDEADALFGKRSEVKDSHDRYANIEVNYLLQRLESYCGLAILATNRKSALDNAFLRRLRFVVNFPFPGLADRRRLWQKAFLQSNADSRLSAPPLGALDYDRLARLNLTGGHIHSAALNAAFLAAAANTKVTMGLILEAAQAEFQKLERPINAAEFQWHEEQEPSNGELPEMDRPVLAAAMGDAL